MSKTFTPRHSLEEPVELDGRTLEGGGQLIRIALCLSALTGVPVQINNIRGNRSGGGGLKAQHLACVNWLAHACNARVEGGEKGSKTLLFQPGLIPGDLSPAFKKRKMDDGGQIYECRLDIGTAGSTGLALQAILPYIMFTKFPAPAPIVLTVTGGTNVSGSPCFEYVKHVLLPTLRCIGLPEITASLGKRGWSQGGSSIGNFSLTIPPRSTSTLPAFQLRPTDTSSPSAKPSPPSHLRAIFVAPSSCLAHFQTVLLPAIAYHFGPEYHVDAGNLDITVEGSLHEERMYLILIATFPFSRQRSGYVLARDWLYDRRIRTHERAATEMAERVTNELAEEWLSGSFVDEHMRDQVVIFQALARGRSEVYAGREEEGSGELREPSLHARTAEWVAKRMLGVKFNVEGGCEGCNFGAPSEADAELVDRTTALDLR